MLSSRGAKHAAAFKPLPDGIADNGKKPSEGGVIDFSNAVNFLMAEEIRKYIETKGAIPTPYMHYNEGFPGPRRLKHAMAQHVDRVFKPFQAVHWDDISFVGGVTALNSMLATVLTDPGEAILLGSPIYGSFHQDLVAETETKLVHVVFPAGVDQFSEQAVDYYRQRLVDARRDGIKVKALLIVNPHNPLGACYTPAALRGLMALCEDFEIHLLADEIYAMTVFDTGDSSKPTFTSVLSFDPVGLIHESRLHVLYGTSKDFAAAGLRSGCLITQNQELTKAVRRITRFHAPAEICNAYVATILEDEAFVTSFAEESRKRLAKHYAIATSMLEAAGVNFFDRGNSGFFLWVDLSPYLRDDADGWAAERALNKKFRDSIIFMSSGEAYACDAPGWFRVIFATPEDVLREGLKRIISIAKQD